MNEPIIYSVNPKKLQEVINIFKNIYRGTEYINQTEHVNRATREEELKESIKFYFSNFMFFSMYPKRINELEDTINTRKTQKEELKGFISSMIRKHRGVFLSAEPRNVNTGINTLANSIETDSLSSALREKENNISKPFQNTLLTANIEDLSYLESTIHLLEPYLHRTEITSLVIKYSHAMVRINDESKIDSIKQILEVFDKYIEKQDVFFQRIEELFKLDSELIPILHKKLKEMFNTLDDNTMKQNLIKISLLELISPTQENETGGF